jgi:hypothetical protein
VALQNLHPGSIRGGASNLFVQIQPFSFVAWLSSAQIVPVRYQNAPLTFR